MLCAVVVAAAASGCTGNERIAKYIRSDSKTRLVLEVDSVRGLDVREAVLEDLEMGLPEILDKPGGVEVRLDDTLEPRGDDYVWTLGELRSFGGSTFDLPVDSSTVKIHVVLVDGRFETDDGGPSVTVGRSWNHRHIAIFDQTIEEQCNAASISPDARERLCTVVERDTLTHEIGHVIGLVNKGLPMVVDHEDLEHPGHTNDPDSVMYWRFEENAIEFARESMSDMPRPNLGFDERCLQDIAALRD